MYFFLLIYIPMNTHIYRHFFLWKVTIFQKQRRKLFCKMSDKTTCQRCLCFKRSALYRLSNVLFRPSDICYTWNKVETTWNVSDFNLLISQETRYNAKTNTFKHSYPLLLICFHRVFFSLRWPYWKQYDALIMWPFH